MTAPTLERSAAAGPQPPRARTSPVSYLSLLDRSRSIGLFTRLFQRHPDIVEIRPGGRRVWLVSDPALARGILTESGRVMHKGEGLRIVERLLGQGLLTANDPVAHRRNRRLIQPALHADRIESYATVMVEAAAAMSARWRDGDVVQMPTEMAWLALDIVGRTLLGEDTEQDARAINAAVNVVLSGYGIGFLPFADRILGSRLPAAARIRDAVVTMQSTVERIVADHRRTGRGGDMVSSLLAANEDGETLADSQIRDETLTLLLAGHETTANALSWAWWLLDRSPRSAARLRSELGAVLGERDPSAADRDALPYTTAVVAETMRLRPPAWMVEREVVEPVQVGPYVAERGVTLLTSPYLLHHDARSWGPDVDVFTPERWLDDKGRFDPSATGAPRGAYLPFGAGSRICIGESFAWTEAVLALATLARSWQPETEPGQRVGTWAAVTLRPHPGLAMRLRAVSPTRG